VREWAGNGEATRTIDLRGLPSGPYLLLLHDRTQRIIKD
jgi:hypothetical protein